MSKFKDALKTTPTEEFLSPVKTPDPKPEPESYRMVRNPKMIQAKTERLVSLVPPGMKKQAIEYCYKNDLTSVSELIRVALTVCMEEDWFGNGRFSEEELFEIQNRE